MIKKLREEYDICKSCAYCEFASKTLEDDRMLCKRKGVVSTEYHCMHFSYDPMKRMPKRIPFAPADFS